ncbi:ATP-binding protein [Streptomyces sp. NPDC050610]|uniref:ATP-binding protein n=1 Tax=Streptomyces sp. NPDC050610 TaxID=3157097 RepID=UPI00342FB581
MGEPYEVGFRLGRRRSSVPRARALLHAVLGSWGVAGDVVDEAELVLSELVTNALRVRVPKDRQVGVRIVWLVEDRLLRLEVSDAGAGWPEVQVPEEGETHGRGLLLVEAVAHQWGVEKREGGIGKTVWATLKTPNCVAEAAEREIAAVTVRAGQCVRVWGTWHGVRSVSGEWRPSGGGAVVLVLDDGPALRVPAAEPLTVRNGTAPSRAGEGAVPG